MNKLSTLFLTENERELILKYGYPFDEIEKQLKEAEGKQIIRVSDHKYWWEQVIVNLHISETEQTNGFANPHPFPLPSGEGDQSTSNDLFSCFL